MKLALMQPYFFPYIGYFQLLNAVDHFVIYDDCQYIKQGWVNRNRYLNNGSPVYFTLPVSKGSMHDLMVDKTIQPQWLKKEAKKFLKSLKQSYSKAENSELLDFIESVVLFESSDMVDYVENSIVKVCDILDIKTTISRSSLLGCDLSNNGQDRVLDVCKKLKATTYINPVGGAELYSKSEFSDQGIKLYFHKTSKIEYMQVGKEEHIPYLSIIDMLLNNGVEKTKSMLREYCLV